MDVRTTAAEHVHAKVRRRSHHLDAPKLQRREGSMMSNRLLYRTRNEFVVGTPFAKAFQLSCAQHVHDPLNVPVFDASMFALPQVYVPRLLAWPSAPELTVHA